MNDSDARRLFLAAAASIAAHQAQSAIVEPAERPVRVLALVGLCAGAAGFWRAPRRARGYIALASGAGPVFGAAVGHLLPLVCEGRVEPASETAILNLGGGGFLFALGTSLLRAGSGKDGPGAIRVPGAEVFTFCQPYGTPT